LKLTRQLRFYSSEFLIAEVTLDMQFSEFREQLTRFRPIVARTTPKPSHEVDPRSRQSQYRSKHQQRPRYVFSHQTTPVRTRRNVKIRPFPYSPYYAHGLPQGPGRHAPDGFLPAFTGQLTRRLSTFFPRQRRQPAGALEQADTLQYLTAKTPPTLR